MNTSRINVCGSGLLRAWVATVILLMAALLVLVQPAVSAPLRNVPQKLAQPDGVVLECLASGDEYFNWLHDENGYVIIQDHSTGYYAYAVKVNGDLVPSQYIAGRVDPAKVGLIPDIKPSPEKLQAMMAASEGVLSGAPPVAAPSTGTINNIVVFIRFKNESEFTDQVSTYDTMFNSAASGANSMLNYFQEVSYNTLGVSTTFYPTPPGATVVSYQDTVNTRGYYQPYDATTNPIGYQGGDNGIERRDREHILLKNAVNAIASQVPTGLNLDGDSDGLVDNVCFIIDGSPTGWASLLWPHKWSLYSQTAYIYGKQVYTYNFQLQTSLFSSGVGVLCHEMMHSLGAPDLYHYSYDGMSPVGSWDVMESNQNPPQHPSAYMKYRYGHWISSIPVISSPGVYTLNPLTTSTGNCYKIASPNSSTEYYVVEYRKRSGTFENSLPGSGLLVYRINTAKDGQGNAYGPPDEVYVYRPNGTCTANGSWSSANYSSDVGRTAINDTTNPAPFLSNCAAGGLSISEVGSCGGAISFRLGASTAGDSYEPDNTCDLAKTIQPSVPQTHSIVLADDVDWVKFTLSQTSSVLLETSGASGDTRMWLYSDCAGTLVEYDDDSGEGNFSKIDRACGADALPAGTYYVKIDEYGNNNEIASYTISLTGATCVQDGWTCSLDVPKTIPDLSTIWSDLPVMGTDTIADVDVVVNITHTWDADLDVYLQHPDGTLVELFTDIGGSGDNFTNTILDDEAAISIASGAAPFAGSYRPEGALSALDGKPVAGTWRLKVIDAAGGDAGNLQSWCLRITTGSPPPTVTNVTSSTGNGCYNATASPIGIQVVFSEAVYVTGSPQLELETGTIDRLAGYSSGSGTNTLMFAYAVQSGDESSDLCYKTTASLTLNGGTIKNGAGTDANLGLPACGASGSLSYNKDIAIDTAPPWSSAGPLACGYTSAVIDVPLFRWGDTGCGPDFVTLWYRRRPLSGGAWGSWTSYPGSYYSSPMSFNTAAAGGDGEYEFYTIAIDSAGNLEAPPPQADCATRILTAELAAPTLNPEPERTPGPTNEISWLTADPIAVLYQAQCSQDANFASIAQDTGWQSRPPDAHTFAGLLTGGDYHFRVRSGYELCSEAIGGWSQTSQAEFDTDTKINVSTIASPGDVVLAGGQTTLFADDFEDGDMAGWVNGSGSYTRQVTNATAAAGTVYSVTLTGGSTSHYDGISHDLASLTPENITFYVRSGSTAAADAYFVVGAGASNAETAAFFYASSNGQMGVHDGTTFWGRSYASQTWYKVRFAFNWSAKKIDYYVDDSLVQGNISFRATSVSSLTKLYLYNYHSSQAWWDQIEFGSASSGYASAGEIVSSPISPSPLLRWGTLSFTKDTSAPETALTVDVLDAATDVTLLEDVASGTDLQAAGITDPSIKLRANLSTANSANTPKLSDWAVTYTESEGTVASSNWSNVESSSQMPVCGLPNRSTGDAIMSSACGWLAFTAWGRVAVLDANTFDLNDGSGPVRVVAPGHSLEEGDYAAATGILDVNSSPRTLTCEARLIRKLD